MYIFQVNGNTLHIMHYKRSFHALSLPCNAPYNASYNCVILLIAHNCYEYIHNALCMEALSKVLPCQSVVTLSAGYIVMTTWQNDYFETFNYSFNQFIQTLMLSGTTNVLVF